MRLAGQQERLPHHPRACDRLNLVATCRLRAMPGVILGGINVSRFGSATMSLVKISQPFWLRRVLRSVPTRTTRGYTVMN